jgi:hypothetical protein
LRLSGIVRGPVLSVGLARDLHCFGCDGLTVWALLALDRVFNRKDMFASVIREFVITASATRLFIVKRNGVLFLLIAL